MRRQGTGRRDLVEDVRRVGGGGAVFEVHVAQTFVNWRSTAANDSLSPPFQRRAPDTCASSTATARWAHQMPPMNGRLMRRVHARCADGGSAGLAQLWCPQFAIKRLHSACAICAACAALLGRTNVLPPNCACFPLLPRSCHLRAPFPMAFRSLNSYASAPSPCATFASAPTVWPELLPLTHI